jgi:hypothetical protein
MQFREFAAAETSALLRRLMTSRADHSKRELQAVRRAFETAMRTVEDKLGAAAPADDAISALVEKLATAATAEIENATTRARAEGQAALDAALQAARAEHADVLKAEQQKTAGVRQELKEASAAQAFADAARREAEAAREHEASQHADAERDLAETRRSLKAAQADAQTARKELKTAHNDLQAAHEELRSVQSEVTAAQNGLKTAQNELKAANATLKTHDQRTKDLEHALAEAEASRVEQARVLRGQMVKAALQPLDHLRSAFQRLTSATSLDDVQGVVIDALATEFSRVALFNVNGNHLEGHRHSGFDLGDISKVSVPLTVDSPLTKAVRDGRVHGLMARELTDTTRTLFGGSPTFVLVLPVAVRGQVTAVLYADDSDHAQTELVTPERRVKFAEVLLWHAVPMLTKLSLEWEALAELREYAESLVKDLESVYTADASKHKPAELRDRLQHNLEYARKRFAERVEGEGPAAARLLDDQLAAAIKTKAATPFARDVAALTGAGAPLAKGRAKAAAEASA